MANRPGIVTIAQDFDRALKDAIARGDLPIPPYPAVALRIQELVNRGEYGLGELSRIVASDATLAADVLRCANSAVYRRGDEVTSLAQAITRVGAQEVARLALGSGLTAHAQAPGPLAPLKRSIWIESVASAVLCQLLARQRGLRQEEAFVLGLLHDFGRVVVTSAIEDLIEKQRTPPRPIEEWEELVDRHHVAAGGLVAGRWGLPELVCEVVALHHGAGGAAGDPGLLAVVQASDQVTALLASRPTLEAADLAEAPGVAAAERDLVVRVVVQIPSFVAAFEGPGQRPTGRPSAVSPPLTALAPGQRQVTFAVTATVEKRTRTYVAAAIATNGIVLLGGEPLPERQLLELTLQCKPAPFQVWATARLCRPEGSGVRVELVPYALGGEARALWAQLYASATAG